MKPITLGVIVGNRGFFPDYLVADARKELTKYFEKINVKPIWVSPEETKLGGIETWDDAQKCAKLFKSHKDEIDGILVTLPNFGDEKAVANTLRYAELNVPVLIHAIPDESSKMTLQHRRDSFCGKISVCNNLVQYGIPFTLTTFHCVSINDPTFEEDFSNFLQTCRVVRGMKNLRVGAVGARTGAFNTVRYSEKILESTGISVETIDLSEIFGRIGKLKDDDVVVKTKVKEIKEYIATPNIPDFALVRMAKLGVVLDKWITENSLKAISLQCWTSIQEYYGIAPCTVMSMYSNSLIPNACEVDVLGSISMYILQLASGVPSALVDWNNNYKNDPDKAVLFHCSNFPKSIFKEAKMDFQEIISGAVGKENTYGTVVGEIKASPMTFLRASTDDEIGSIRAYIGEGETTKDPLDTFGGYGVLHVPQLQELLQFMCENGFEHHTAVNPTHVAQGIAEALDKYLGWDLYFHTGLED